MKKMIIAFLLLHSASVQPIAIIGHRGASGPVQENTLSSFEYAIQCGVDMIELDVWKCASGELVVFHDAKVDRLTDGHGYVALKTLNELKCLKIRDCEVIPTLIEVFELVNRRVKIYIELKGAHIIEDVLQLIDYYVVHKKWNYDDFLIGSFDHVQLQTVKNVNKSIPVIAIVYGIPISLGASVMSTNADIVCLDSEFINQQFVDDIHARGMLVYVYTINDRDDLARSLSYGVDGIITDNPDYIRIIFSL
ncbi:MAG TPA: glycerophosphodiester phosphodiesterase [Candidatus Babeliales bacterium]|nr:glycerophosphodiester phosphodiesterase [Candidatus Babeliales bacterium]